jgi:hypothetical protein
MKKLYSIVMVVSVLLFSGCMKQNNTAVPTNSEPQWLIDPYIENDVIAAVGCAGQHFKGESAQKKLAISRAIDQIATSQKVKVINRTDRSRYVSGQTKSSSMASQSSQVVDGVSVSTRTKAIYKKRNGEICAWVVQK